MSTKSYLTATLLSLLAASAVGQEDLTFRRPTSTRQINGCG